MQNDQTSSKESKKSLSPEWVSTAYENKKRKKRIMPWVQKATPQPIPFPKHTLAFEGTNSRHRAHDVIRAPKTNQTIT